MEPAQDTKEDGTYKDSVSRHTENMVDMKPAKDDMQLDLVKDSGGLKSRLSVMDSKLREVSAPKF